MMQAYNQTLYDPPAPIADVILRNPESGETLYNVRMLIDTGADVSLLPRSSLELTGLLVSLDEQYELMGFDGHQSVSSVVWAEVIFLGKTFRGKYLLIDHECGVLGRDILNYLSLLFDGPNLNWKEVKG